MPSAKFSGNSVWGTGSKCSLADVMEEIDLAVFTFDNNSKLRLVNRAGERLLGRQEERLLDLRGGTGLGPVSKEKPRTQWSWLFQAFGRWGCVAGLFAREACRTTWSSNRFERPSVTRNAKRGSGLFAFLGMN